MPQVSRPLIGLLVTSVLFLAVWMVALKPSSGSGAASASNPTVYSPAIRAAKHVAPGSPEGVSATARGTKPAVKPAVKPAAVEPATKPAAIKSAATSAAPAATRSHPVKRAAHARAVNRASHAHAVNRASRSAPAKQIVLPQRRVKHAAAGDDPALLDAALTQRKVVLLLVYNPAATEDRALRAQLSALPVPARRVVKLAVPIARLGDLPAITTAVQINEAPTFVLIDGHGSASTIVGFADSFELGTRVAQALATR